MLIVLSLEKFEEEMEGALSMEGARFAVIARKDAKVSLNTAMRLRSIKDIFFVETGEGGTFQDGLAAGLLCGAMRKEGEEILIISDEEAALPDGCGIRTAKTLSGGEAPAQEEPSAEAPKKRRTRRAKKTEPQPDTGPKAAFTESENDAPSALEEKIRLYRGDAETYSRLAADAVRDSLDPIGFEMVLRMKFAAADEDVSHAENIYQALRDDFKTLKELA